MNNLRRITTLLIAALLPFATLFFPIHCSQTPLKTSPITSKTHLEIAHSTCQGTLYPSLCVSTLSTFPDLHSKPLPQIISAAVNFTVGEVRASSSNFTATRRHLENLNPLEKRAFKDCLELLDDTISDLKTAISDLNSRKIYLEKYYDDLQTVLSAAMTNQDTCLDGFAYSKHKEHVREYLENRLTEISHHVSNALALLKKLKTTSFNEAFPDEEEDSGAIKHGFPTWVSKKERALLEAEVTETTNEYDLVVAKDGSGNFTTIGEAIAAAPNSSVNRFVIYIKEGVYYEYVEVLRKKTNLMLVGDGIEKTLIKGNRSVVDGWTTFRSATVAVVGNGFIAKGITFENYAGPSKHQAVALRSGSDFSAFYQCSFVAYQDTLYVHSLRQFYRDCDVYGTVDFIFGNAAVVFQNCKLYARRPNENQRNIFTAQGREDPNQNTGISLLGCKVAAAADLIPVQSSFETYLGRPWKEYSRTVIIESSIGNVVNPAGWLEWSGDFALKTLYYGEYMNTGPGSNTSSRVTWPGYRVINNSIEASQFSVGNFIQGKEWLANTSIPYYVNLTST